MSEADTVGYEAAKDLCERVADVEPGHSTALLAFFIPHCDDEHQDGCNTGGQTSVSEFLSSKQHEPAFEDAKQSADN